MNAVAILSGGMDSTTAFWLASPRVIECVSFDYGQRHRRELKAAEEVARRAGVAHRVIDIRASFGQLVAGTSALTGGEDVPHGHYEDETMRKTVVPGRNLVFIALAAARAGAIGATSVIIGAHAGDHAIYPDCRSEFLHAARRAIALSGYSPITLEAPFAEVRKEEIVRLGHGRGVPYEVTWSCYEGGDRHCGKCGTCVERREAFERAGVVDPTEYEPEAPSDAL